MSKTNVVTAYNFHANQRGNSREIEVLSLPTKDIRKAKYQRPLNESLVKTIVNTFDINRMRPIEVSFRNGFYWVWDGQHRLQAYLDMGLATIPCLIHYELTYEQEAYLFAVQHQNVKKITANQRWNALAEAKDESTIKAIDVANSLGYTIDPDKGSSKNNIIAVQTIINIVIAMGFKGLYDILSITRKSMDGERDAIVQNMLGGLLEFFVLYKTCEMFNYNRLQKCLKGTESSLILSEANSDTTANLNKATKVAKRILYYYNKGLSDKNRLPYKFVG